MDSHINQKVYVNPNFNRTGTHLNKHFPHQAFNATQNIQRKIYVNPNFMPHNKNENCFQHINPIILQQNVGSISNFAQCNEQIAIHNKDCNLNIWNKLELYKVSEMPIDKSTHTEKCISDKNQPPVAPIIKSRYCLVNSLPKPQTAVSTAVQQKPSQNTLNIVTNTYKSKGSSLKNRYHYVRRISADSPKNKPSSNNCKVKISKYKMVTINNLKTTLLSPRVTVMAKSLPVTKINTVKPIIISAFSNGNKSNFKLTKYSRNNNNSSLETRGFTKSNNRQYKTQMKYQTKKIVKRNFKINNVPCPLYTKYGKCLRRAKGNCEYLHDKNHISLCRKFLKGICHDNNCLLSHELSDKKMPTCYFYLKGMCTKEQCPYVHIKLNEKAKLCQDFLKGYCEKGENCLLRHVKKQYSSKNVSSSLNKSLRETPKPVRKSKCNMKLMNKNISSSKDLVSNHERCELDHRYYKDVVSECDEKCEVIKPMRCKLGTLPSFIQL